MGERRLLAGVLLLAALPALCEPRCQQLGRVMTCRDAQAGTVTEIERGPWERRAVTTDMASGRQVETVTRRLGPGWTVIESAGPGQGRWRQERRRNAGRHELRQEDASGRVRECWSGPYGGGRCRQSGPRED
ncbi:MAG TPA: hypothetical protein DD491_06830 [Halieaceae bacterium]|nr:hypothetical protein [Halieaceae bacterium]